LPTALIENKATWYNSIIMSGLPNLATPTPEFLHQVRTALTHLYDHAYLQNHPLAFKFAPLLQAQEVTRAQQLRRLLLDTIDALRPQTQAHSEEARAYAILCYRCMDGLSMGEIEAKLALSRRQTYREYTKGILAIASHLWAALQQMQPTPLPTTDWSQDVLEQRRALAEEEVNRLRKDTHPEALVLSEVVEGLCKLLTPRIARTGIQITLLPTPSSSPVLADRIMLRQALLNLLSHALDTLTTQSELQVAITTAGSKVRLSLQATHNQALPARTTPTVKREGVGLAIAQELILAQGGTLTLNLADGAWQAEVFLPTVEAATILVIDDNETLLALFQRYLSGYNVTLLTVANGQQALALLTHQQPRLIVLDVMMPHQDGWDLLSTLQENPVTAALPVIVCSVLKEAELALALGASDYITKPVSQAQLLTVLQRWLGPLSLAV
jgi:CheY-like chemotaxis protein